MRIIKALSLTVAFLIPVAVLAAPRLADSCHPHRPRVTAVRRPHRSTEW